MKLTSCRICGSSRLDVVFDLGFQPLANSFLNKKQLTQLEDKYPLQVCFCQDCNLCQLSEVVSPEILFRSYVYYSSKMPQLPEHFRLYATEVIERFIVTNKDLVVEIGSNDGVLLQAIKNGGARVLGIDPARNIARIANARGVETLPEFFSEDLSKVVLKKYGPARAIIGNNVVAHINNHHDLVKGVKNLLTSDGVFIFEAPYLVDMFTNLSFDTIYHEHLSYLAIRPLKRLFEQYQMEIFDVRIFPVQGNSIRVYAGNKDKHSIFKSVPDLIKKEKEMGLDKVASYKKLFRKIAAIKENVVDELKNLKAQGKVIAGYGAPAKGNTLLNYYGIGTDLLDYVTEALPSKIGLYTPGMHIPVVDIRKARQHPPDYYLLLAWNYRDAIYAQEKDFVDEGGKFIMPIGETLLENNSLTPSKKNHKNKQVLVTGGAGYVGSVLVRKLLERGYAVKILDKLIFSDSSIKDLEGKVELINSDIRDFNPKILDNVASIIHLAGFSTEPTSQFNPRLTDLINHIATERLAILAKEKGIGRFVYPSSCSVYFTFNTPLNPPVFKESDPVNPISSYSLTKRCSEQVLTDLTDKDFRPTIFRKGTVFGLSPRMRYDLVFNSFVKDAFFKKVMTVDAAGEVWRPMINIQDVADTYIAALELPLYKVGGKLFNVVDENWKIGDLAKLIRDIVKKKFGIQIDLDVKPYGLTRNYKADNTLFKKTFSFKHGKSMEESVSELWKFFSTHKEFQPNDRIYYNDLWYRDYFATNAGTNFVENKKK